jgi:acyl-CoA dehydrogenase
LDLIIGGAERRGDGWRMMMECLSLGRGISLPGLSTGLTKLSFCMSGAYAQIRHQFKRSVGDFEGVANALGEIGGFAYLCEATRLFTAQAVDQGVRPSIASAITKYQLTELARKAVNNAMDIHAGRGIQFGPRNYIGSLYQSLPIGITVEGANILTRSLIIFGQGLMRCHPYLRDELIASEQPDHTRNKTFDSLLLSHIGFILQNFTRALIYGLSGGCGIVIKQQTRLQKYLQQLTRMSYALSLVCDISMAAIGAELKLKESLSARLGDVLSHLYMAAAVMKLYQDEGQSTDDWPFVVWSLDYCLAQIQRAFDEFFINFPQRLLAGLMRWIIFPWGRAYFPPADQHTQLIAEVMQKSSAVRDRLSRYCYIGGVKDATGQMEAAFQNWQQVKLLWQKAHKFSKGAQHPIDVAYQAGQLTKDEYEKLNEFAKQYWDVLQVDEFDDRERK